MQESPPDAHRVPAPTPWELVMLPAALLAAFILIRLDGILSTVVWLISMVFHELGHALIFWLRSQMAVPSFGMTAPLHPGSSLWVFLILLALAALAFRQAREHGYPILSGAAILFAALLCIFTWLVPRAISEQIMIYGGLGGEIYLAALALVLFYERLPKRLQWEKNRYPILGSGAVAFVNSGMRWYQAQRDVAVLPMGALLDFGALFGGPNESSGDLDRLLRDFHWTQAGIVSAYIWTTLACITLLIAYYAHKIAHSKAIRA